MLLPRPLFLCASNQFHGSERSLLEILRYLRGRVETPLVVLPPGPGKVTDECEDCGAETIRGSFEGAFRKPRETLTRARNLARMADGRAVTHVVANNAVFGPTIGMMKLSGWQGKTVMISRDVAAGAKREFVGKWGWAHDLNCYNSDYLVGQNTTPFLRSAFGHRVEVWHNTIDVPMVQRASEEPLPLQLQRSRPIIGMFGRISPPKGFLDVVRLLARSGGHSVTVLIVGEGDPDHPEYQRDIQRTAGDAGIELIIQEFDENPWKWMRVCSLIAIPSQLESFGRITIEAGALGKCVVVSPVGGLREIIEDRRTGFYSSWRREDGGFLMSLAYDDSTQRRIGKMLKAEVQERFDTFSAKNGLPQRLAEYFTRT